MITTYPEDENRPYFILEASEYAQHFTNCQQAAAGQLPSLLPSSPADQPNYLPSQQTVSQSEEEVLEKLGISVGLACIEIFMGRRPLYHISPWTTADCYRSLSDQLKRAQEALNYRIKHFPHRYCSRSQQQIRPRRIIVQKVAASAYEICLLVTDDYRTRALALRAEIKRKQWKFTTIAIA